MADFNSRVPMIYERIDLGEIPRWIRILILTFTWFYQYPAERGNVSLPCAEVIDSDCTAGYGSSNAEPGTQSSLIGHRIIAESFESSFECDDQPFRREVNQRRRSIIMENWISPNVGIPIVQTIGRSFISAQQRVPDFFPNLRTDSELVLACDYSGEHKSSAFRVLNFLLVDSQSVRQWDDARMQIRSTYLSDGRRHAFKSLSDILRQKALVPFLKASSLMNGILVSVAVEKSLNESDLGFRFNSIDTNAIKPAVLAKLIQIAVFGSILIAGHSVTGQNIMWITDDDEIVSNPTMIGMAQQILGAILKACCQHPLGEFYFGIASLFDDQNRAEDLCSIPDLAGGALADTLTAVNDSIPRSANLITPDTTLHSTKTDIISAWLATLSGPLKHVQILVRPEGTNQLLVSFCNPEILQEGTHSKLWVAPDKGWNKSSADW